MKTLLKTILLAFGFFLIPALLSGQELKITSGGYWVVGSGYVNLTQNLTNNGTYTDNNGTLIFSGSTQAINGSNATTLNNLTISSGAATTIGTSGQTLKGVLTSNGTLSAGGNITLLSTSGQTALVSGTGTGSITGNVIMQRYLESGFGYKYLCSPFQGATVNEFSEDMDLGAAFPTFYRYEENRDTAWWFSYVTGTNVLSPMAGYAVNTGASIDSKTIDISGVVSNGTMSVNLFNYNRTHTQGFNLVGNPYPSPIDWDAVSGWTRTNIDNAIYYFNSGSSDQYVGSYSTYIGGVSSDGIANNIIPAMQGFFVHVTDGTFPVAGSLGFSNAIRINTLNPVFHKSASISKISLIRLSAGFDGMRRPADPLVIRLDPEASWAFNAQMDAVKLMNTDPAVTSFYTVIDKTSQYAIKALPPPSDSLTVIPLGITMLQQGMVDFSMQNSGQQTPWLKYYFRDNKRRAIVDLNASDSYQVFLEEGICDERFSLVLSMNEIQTNSGSGNELVAYYKDGKIYIYLDLFNTEKADLLVTDILGRMIYRESVSGTGFYPVAPDLRSGVYVVTLRSINAVASKKLIIPQR